MSQHSGAGGGLGAPARSADGRLELDIEDHGTRPAAGAPAGGCGIGLVSMRERAELMGGTSARAGGRPAA